jgi:histidyl-tRNA synthetase
LRVFGLDSKDFKVRLSDRDLWLLLLAAEGLDETGSAAALAIIDKLERTDRVKVVAKLTEIVGEEAEAFLTRVEEVIAIRDFESLSAYILNLPLEGDLAEQAQQRLADWQALLSGLQSSGAGDFIQIDLGIVRGLAYYTGFVFEAFEASGEGRALAGGGRYDELVKKLGGPEMPAVGFAMGDVTLADLLESKKLLATYVESPDFIAIIGGVEARDAALGDAALLRSMGYRVDYPFKDQGFGKQFKEANQKGARFALIYGTDEIEKGVVKIRDFSTGAEQEYPRQGLAEIVPELMASGLFTTEQ